MTMNDEFLDSSVMDVNQERNAKILALIDEGMSYAEIGRRIGLTRARVSQIAIQHGYVVRPTLVNPDNLKSSNQA